MRGNITRRGKRSWRLKFEVGERDPATGKRQTRFVTVRGTKRDAEAELTRLLKQVEDGAFVEPSKLTVGDFLKHWLTGHAQHRVSATTHEGYGWIINTHLIPALGSHRLAKLAPLHIQEYYTDALTKGRVRKRKDGKAFTMPPLSAQTVHHHHRVLSEALRQAVRQRLIIRNPCDDVDPPRPVRREMKVLDQKQAAHLLRAAKGSPIEIPVLLAVTTGMRRGELLGLRWQDVDLDRRVLSVTQTLEQTSEGLAFKGPKTAKGRRAITLPALTVDALRRHRKRQAEERLRLGPAFTDNGLVCCQGDGAPMPPNALTDAFRRLAKRLKLDVRLHGLRHSHITHLLAAGVHPKVASERAGHASVSITLDTYSHVVQGLQEDAASRIDAALRTHLKR